MLSYVCLHIQYEVLSLCNIFNIKYEKYELWKIIFYFIIAFEIRFLVFQKKCWTVGKIHTNKLCILVFFKRMNMQ